MSNEIKPPEHCGVPMERSDPEGDALYHGGEVRSWRCAKDCGAFRRGTTGAPTQPPNGVVEVFGADGGGFAAPMAAGLAALLWRPGMTNLEVADALRGERFIPTPPTAEECARALESTPEGGPFPSLWVAGAAGCVHDGNPALSNAEIAAIIRETAQPDGRLDIGAAVEKALATK